MYKSSNKVLDTREFSTAFSPLKESERRVLFENEDDMLGSSVIKLRKLPMNKI
tara:strand:- start:811 stop:969 length:159 start_codon:yes stop_codon:yes gene_type:complete